MKTLIAISILNQAGSVASIEDGDMDSISIFTLKNSIDAEKVCMGAAKKLRDLADRFEELAKLPNPFSETTQANLNRKP